MLVSFFEFPAHFYWGVLEVGDGLRLPVGRKESIIPGTVNLAYREKAH